MNALPGLPQEPVRCFAPDCRLAGFDMPVLFFGPGRNRAEATARMQVAMLEVPKLVCHEHMKTFRPDLYFTPDSKANIEAWLRGEGYDLPSWQWFGVTWLEHTHPAYLELMGTGQARLTGGHGYVVL